MVRILTLDTPQKETDRYTQAGAEVIAAVPRDETVIFINKRLGIADIMLYFEGLDFVFLEGFESEKGFCRVVAAKTVEEAKELMVGDVVAVSGVIGGSGAVDCVLGVSVVNVLVEAALLADLIERC
jgi:molybdopterin-guanine dinucleotide biosynthesis protein